MTGRSPAELKRRPLFFPYADGTNRWWRARHPLKKWRSSFPGVKTSAGERGNLCERGRRTLCSSVLYFTSLSACANVCIDEAKMAVWRKMVLRWCGEVTLRSRPIIFPQQIGNGHICSPQLIRHEKVAFVARAGNMMRGAWTTAADL